MSALADESLTQSCGIFTPCFNTATCQWIHESVHRQLHPAALIWGPVSRLWSAIYAEKDSTPYCFLFRVPALGPREISDVSFHYVPFSLSRVFPRLAPSERAGQVQTHLGGGGRCPLGQAMLRLPMSSKRRLGPTWSCAFTRALRWWGVSAGRRSPTLCIPCPRPTTMLTMQWASARAALKEEQPYRYPQKAQDLTTGKTGWASTLFFFHMYPHLRTT